MTGDKQIGVVGAGVSGLLACKHLMEKGFRPVVFEWRSSLGGVWAHQTIDSTKLQTPKTFFQFSDWPWPPTVTEAFPDHDQVLDYIHSYAVRFNLITRIMFNHKVVAIDYDSTPSNGDDVENACSWDEWAHGGRKWKMVVQDNLCPLDPPKVFKMDFVILCNGNYSNFPNVPRFPVNKGPEVFNGIAIHSMDYAAMNTTDAIKFIKDKRVTVVGFQKSAVDIAVEVAKTNGVRKPCMIVLKKEYWMIPEHLNEISFLSQNRFSELMIHKPDEGFFLSILVLLLYPLAWILSTSIETYLKCTYPLKKHKMIPKHSFMSQLSSCMLPTLPPTFYKRVDEGSIILNKSKSFHFSPTGIILDDDTTHIATDIVIFATGFEPDKSFASIFKSMYFQACILGSSTPLYRECIHPRIPQVALLGYPESPANLFRIEMQSKWLAHLMAGHMKLPTVKAMEEDTSKWEIFMRQYGLKRSCITFLLQVHFNDLLCKDMGRNPSRKSWFIPEYFAPYVPADYANL